MLKNIIDSISRSYVAFWTNSTVQNTIIKCQNWEKEIVCDVLAKLGRKHQAVAFGQSYIFGFEMSKELTDWVRSQAVCPTVGELTVKCIELVSSEKFINRFQILVQNAVLAEIQDNNQ